MPTKPGKGEKQNDFHSRCMKAMTDEGKPEDQANAACYSMWQKREGSDEPEPMSMMPNQGETQDDFQARCMKVMGDKGMDPDAAAAKCQMAWGKRESVHPADAMISEASTLDWSSVDKTRLPASCFLWVDDPAKKGTWHFPVYEGAGGINPQTGMYREAGGVNLQALRIADAGSRSGKMNVPASVKARLNSLLRLYEETSHYEAYRTPVLAESAADASRLVEKVDFTGAEFVEEEGGKRVVKNVAMLGPESSHGYGYRQEAMAKAVSGKLYESVRIFINHKDLKTGRDLMELAGVFRNPRHEGGKVRGDAHLLPDEYGTKFWNIANHMPEAASCSHVADGRLVKAADGQWVEEITKVYSVDLVVQGATTRNVFEGEVPPEVKKMEYKDIDINTLKVNRPDLVHILVLEGAKSRDEEIQALIGEKQTLTTDKDKLVAEKETLTKNVGTLTEERKQLQAKLEEMNALEATRQKEAVVAKVVSTLPEHARTDSIKKLCMEVKTGKDGFDAALFEAAVTELVKPIKAVCEQGGVHGMGGEQNRGSSLNEMEKPGSCTLKLT